MSEDSIFTNLRGVVDRARKQKKIWVCKSKGLKTPLLEKIVARKSKGLKTPLLEKIVARTLDLEFIF
jgi:ribosomal protein S17